MQALHGVQSLSKHMKKQMSFGLILYLRPHSLIIIGPIKNEEVLGFRILVYES